MKSLFVLLLVFAGITSSGLHAQQEAVSTISGTLAETPDASTLYAALEASDLLTELNGEGQYMLLAPSDEAFGSLPEGVVEKLLQPENKTTLQDLLKNHLLGGADGDGEMAMDRLKGADGSVTSTIETTNGVIYVIDRVLLPAGFDVEGL